MAKTLTTIEQKTVELYDDELITIRANDGQIYVSLRHLCDSIGVARQSQVRRIRDHYVLSKGYSGGIIMIPPGKRGGGGRQQAGLLRVDLVPLWLSGIDTKRVKENVRGKLEKYQEEVAKVLWEAFQEGRLTSTPSFDDLLQKDSPAVNAYKQALAIVELARNQVLLEARLDDYGREMDNMPAHLYRSLVGKSTQRHIIVFFLLMAAVLRLVGLNNVSPPGLAHDEVANWLIDRSVLAGNHAVYFTRAYGHEAGFHYVQAAFVALLGDHALALRLPAAFAGLLGVAVSYALVRKLYGRFPALVSTALLATLFWPIFYSRLGLRAISLPLFSGLSAYFFVVGMNLTQRGKGAKTQRRKKETESRPPLPRSPAPFLLAGLFAGLSLHTYMAARALPIFYGLFVVYLALFHREVLKERWVGLVWFTAVFAIVSAPLAGYLLANPGAEFRIEEVSAPLQAMREGNLRPVLENGVQIIGMFGWAGDLLWRQNVAGQPVFEPVGALLFYAGVLVALWRWRDGRFAFTLLWVAVSTIPSIVTINAPSTIRIINVLPLLTVFPALLIHIFLELSTDNPKLSTGVSKIGIILVLTMGTVYAIRSGNDVFKEWPVGGDVPFVWQQALTDTAVFLDDLPQPVPVAVGGWSPDTMDPNTMTLLLQRDDMPISHFNPEDGTLILPAAADDQPMRVIRPSILKLHPYWEEQLTGWDAVVTKGGSITQYRLQSPPDIQPQFPDNTLFGNQIRFLGYDLDCDASCRLVSYWQVEAMPAEAMRLFVHVLDEGGNVLAEDYRLDNLDPQSLWFPHWQSGDLILQIHEFSPDTSQATAFRIGFFNPYTCDPGPCRNLLTEAGDPFILLKSGR